MKTQVAVLLSGILCGAELARAGNADLEIHVTPRNLDHNEKRAADASKTEVQEHWVYDVTFENKTFRELTNLQVEYIAFFTKVKFGTKDAPETKRRKGTLTLPSLKAHEKKALTTEPIEIARRSLAGGWYFPTGGSMIANDSLTGLWVRVLQGGAIFAEYANPSNLLKEKWE